MNKLKKENEFLKLKIDNLNKDLDFYKNEVYKWKKINNEIVDNINNNSNNKLKNYKSKLASIEQNYNNKIKTLNDNFNNLKLKYKNVKKSLNNYKIKNKENIEIFNIEKNILENENINLKEENDKLKNIVQENELELSNI